MYPHRSPSKIQPKVSTLPRQKTEAAQYLDMYKLTIEKKRLQQELAALEQRRVRLEARLAKIDHQVETLETGAHQLRDANPSRQRAMGHFEPTSNIYPPTPQTRSEDEFGTVLLEY